MLQTKHQFIPRARSVLCFDLMSDQVLLHTTWRVYDSIRLTCCIVLLLPDKTTGYTTQIRNIDYNLTSEATFPLSIILEYWRYLYDINREGNLIFSQLFHKTIIRSSKHLAEVIFQLQRETMLPTSNYIQIIMNR